MASRWKSQTDVLSGTNQISREQHAMQIGDQNRADTEVKGSEPGVGAGGMILRLPGRFEIVAIGTNVGGTQETDQRRSGILSARDDEARRLLTPAQREAELCRQINDRDRTTTPPCRESRDRREARLVSSGGAKISATCVALRPMRIGLPTKPASVSAKERSCRALGRRAAPFVAAASHASGSWVEFP